MKLLNFPGLVFASREFFIPDKKGYRNVADAYAACASEEGAIAELTDLSLKDFIFKDPLVQRKPFVILSENGDIKYFTNQLEKLDSAPRRRTITVCVKGCQYIAEDPLDDDHYKIISQKGLDRASARRSCQSYGKNWDLAIFNFKKEFDRINGIVRNHCMQDESFWVGYNNFEETIFGQKVLGKKEGFSTSIKLPLEAGFKKGSSDGCVILQNGKFSATSCDKKSSRTPEGLDTKVGYICEKHNPCEELRSNENFGGFEDEKYFISSPGFFSADEAKLKCSQRGPEWTLLNIENAAEHTHVTNLISSGCSPYWTGMTNKNGSQIVTSSDGTDIHFTNWDTHIGWGFKPMPHFHETAEIKCIRMRGGMYNHGHCYDTNGYFKTEPIGYICEKKFRLDYVEKDVSDPVFKSVH